MTRTPILAEDTGGTVHDRLAGIGADAIVDALAALERGNLQAVPQSGEGVTYAHKLSRADAQIDFAMAGRSLVDRIRAFDPVPGATASLARDQPVPIKLWRARAIADFRDAALPGTVLRADPGGLLISCHGGAIAALELQKPGGRRLPCDQFLRGFPVRAGERFVSQPRS
jgi:methionyl-tRNA formyltransferase